MKNIRSSNPPKGAAQRFGSPAADLNKTRLRKTTFSAKWPPHPRAEGGQVEPVLGRKYQL
jgi:hypothetical protein